LAEHPGQDSARRLKACGEIVELKRG